MEQLDPEQAARELRNELGVGKSERDTTPPTESQKGMGLASFVVGTVIAIIIFPGYYFLSPLCLLLLIPGAILGLIFGRSGNRTAFGVAGMALSSIAILEGLTALGIYQFKEAEEEQHRKQAGKETRARESAESTRINDEHAKADALAKKTVADADAERDRVAQREEQARVALEEKERTEKEQGLALDAAKRKEEEDKEKATREQALQQKQEQEKQAVASKPIKEEAPPPATPPAKSEIVQKEDPATKLAAAQALYREKAANLEKAKAASVKARTALRIAEANAKLASDGLTELNNMRPTPENANQLRETYMQRRTKGEADARKARAAIEETDEAVKSAEVEEKRAREVLAASGTAAKAAEPEVKKAVAIYVLKDGKSIHVISAVLADDEYILKTESGMQTVKKADVAEIKKTVADSPSQPRASNQAKTKSTETAPSFERNIGLFEYRNPEGRKLMVERYGGSKATESSVELALKWLALHQEADGHWDASKYGAVNKVDTAVTGLAVLAFLGAGNTEKTGIWNHSVSKAVAWLKSKQQANSLIFDPTDASAHRAIGYPGAIATLAIAEAAGMSRESSTQSVAQRAINYCTREHQQGEGTDRLGWRYAPKTAGDISVSGWFIMAMKSAKGAGLAVDPSSFEGAMKFIDSVEVKNGNVSQYSYQPGKDANKRRCAIGNLARQILGTPVENLQASVESFVNDGGIPNWGNNGDAVDLYYWYYGTLCTFQQGGEVWNRWNEGLKKALTENQSRQGADTGSWPAVGDFSSEWGSVGQTALSCLCLEIYYRYKQSNSKN
jgi:hypothetical protein